MEHVTNLTRPDQRIPNDAMAYGIPNHSIAFLMVMVHNSVDLDHRSEIHQGTALGTGHLQR